VTTPTSPQSPAPIAQLFDLRGNVAIVTGGALGIGQAIAERLAEASASVLIADINLEAAQRAVDVIVRRGGTARAMRSDAGSVADASAVAEAAVSAWGRLDILINNAGIFPFAPALDLTLEQWEHVLRTNLTGAFFYAQAAAKRMIAAGHGGRIVNIASVDALHPTGNLAHYDASKGGMVMLTKSLALELGRHQITVNAIAPGGIDTPGARAVTEAARQAAGARIDDLSSEAFLARIPLGRTGQPDDIATVALFLASGAAVYMTGSLLVVDGGYLLS
jgi:2-deoxy-D-gluconate 3-dehydrogenase